MNIIHISDLHFGPYHWKGNDEILLEKINSYNPDIVINTGDMTSDSLEVEYIEAKEFLKQITCKHLISVIGNHDKYSKRSQELFKEYITNPDVIYPHDKNKIKKQKLFIDRKTACLKDYFTDINFLKTIEIGKKVVLIICIDSNVLHSDFGFVEESILEALSLKIGSIKYDTALLVIHHSILGTDECPLINSKRVIGFVNKHKIEYVLCGHTHEMDLRRSYDLYYHHHFTQFMCGSTSSINVSREGSNTFIYYNNIGEDNFHIYLIRIFVKYNHLEFIEEKVW